MVRDADDHSGGVTLSSIALLQERFRQLQKMKELRQERQVMRTLSMRRPPSPPPPPHLALSLWPDSQTKHAESRAMKAEAPRNLASTSYDSTWPQFNLGNSDKDIDTSLRL